MQNIASIKENLAMSGQVTGQINDALRATRGLTLYRSIREDPVCRAMIVFLEKAARHAPPESLLDTYGEIFFLLADKYNKSMDPVGNAWQDHLLELILYQSNPFSEAAAAVPFEQLGESLKQGAAWDLQKLQVLYAFEASTVLDLTGRPESTVGRIPAWGELSLNHGVKDGPLSKAREIKALLAADNDWRVMVKPLADYYYQEGAGIFGKYGPCAG